MPKNQTNVALILDYAVNTTKDYEHSLEKFEMRRPKLSLEEFWCHLVQNLGVDPITSAEAAKLIWRLTSKNIRLSNNLLYKLSSVCLMLAQKLYEDENNTLQSFSIVSGVSKKDLKSLEVETLVLLDFNLNLTQQERQSLPEWLASSY